MKDEKRNLAASVATRLLKRSRQAGIDYETLLTSFCLERLLHRLGSSSVRDRFVLKGAMLLRLWSDQPPVGWRSNALRAFLKAETERGSGFLRLANALSALYP